MKTTNLSNPQSYHHSLRLKEYDYSSAGAYFLTLCTQNRVSLFGNIINDAMVLNKNGKIVRDELIKTPSIRHEIELDAFAVMPNHLHVIVWITECSGDRPVAHRSDVRTALVEINKLKTGSVGAFVAGFKSSVTRQINESNQTPGLPVWQRNYYEHVIRDENELTDIREYISTNPLKWTLDRENPDCKI